MNAPSHVSPAPLSLLQVSEQGSSELAPTSAFVHVVLTADRFFSGQVAMEKAEELRRLALALENGGLSKSALALEGASLDVSTGVFTKSSSVTYRLRLHVTNLERLGDVFDAVAASKKAQLTHLTWVYPEGAPAALLRACAARANAKALAIAEALGIVLDGVHAVRDEAHEDLPSTPACYGGAPLTARKRGAGGSPSMAEEFGGLELAPKKRAFAKVYVDFRIKHA